MSTILDYNTFYLVGIKGVAMTSLAQCLVDADKKVIGSDVAEEFVTQPILDKLNIHIDTSFQTEIPNDVNCVIYTAAHQAQDNPQVVQAKEKNIQTLTHAEALADLFNAKKGIAVCGVGGKSTVSAMIAWITEKSNNQQPTANSYSIGVGDIPGLGKTGQWSADSEYFIAEADDYVIDPAAPSRGEEITPRFSFLKPYITVCTNLKFDHPDVYQDFDHTKEVFLQFFNNIKPNGILIINGDDEELVKLSQKVRDDITIITYSYNLQSTLNIQLSFPGKFNILNAIAAITACQQIGIEVEDGVEALKTFCSTKRRFEYIGEKHGVKYYDDYAHHPHEVKAAIEAIQQWYPNSRVVIAFQSHTYSRTKQLFDEFIDALSIAKEVVMIDIFASAREKDDPTVSSDLLVEKLEANNQRLITKNLHTIENLATYFKQLPANTVVLTLGAGDIYKVHELINV